MQKYRNRKKPLAAVALLCSVIFGGCSERSGVQEMPAPPILSVEDIASDYASYEGTEVVLLGHLVVDADRSYYLIPPPQKETQAPSGQQKIRIDFGSIPPRLNQNV